MWVYQACPESMIKEYISHKFQYYLICIYLASEHKLLSIIYLQISYHLSTNYSLCAIASLVLRLPSGSGQAIPSNASYLEYAASVYSLKDTYNAGNFFSSFDLLSGPDPTGGFVNYQGVTNFRPVFRPTQYK